MAEDTIVKFCARVDAIAVDYNTQHRGDFADDYGFMTKLHPIK